MKIGDLVKTQKLVENKLVDRYGIILETGKWTGNKDLRVLWDAEAELENSSNLIVLVND